MPSLFDDLPPEPGQEYAFTEILTLHISTSTDLTNEESPAGKHFAAIIRSYVSNEGTGLVWWSRLLETPEVVKIVVDWRDKLKYDELENSGLKGSWGDIKSTCFVFSSWENDRRNAFTRSSFGDIVSCILTFRFSSESEKRDEWSQTWDNFSRCALSTEGGVVSSGTCGGWAVDQRSFCGVVKYRDVKSMKAFLSGEASINGGWGKMKQLADEGLNVEFASMYCLENGWLGGVTVEKRENQTQKNMFTQWNGMMGRGEG